MRIHLVQNLKCTHRPITRPIHSFNIISQQMWTVFAYRNIYYFSVQSIQINKSIAALFSILQFNNGAALWIKILYLQRSANSSNRFVRGKFIYVTYTQNQISIKKYSFAIANDGQSMMTTKMERNSICADFCFFFPLSRTFQNQNPKIFFSNRFVFVLFFKCILEMCCLSFVLNLFVIQNEFYLSHSVKCR